MAQSKLKWRSKISSELVSIPAPDAFLKNWIPALQMVLLGKVASVVVVIVTAKKNMIALRLASVLAEPFMVLLSPTSQPPHEAPSDPRHTWLPEIKNKLNTGRYVYPNTILNREYGTLIECVYYVTSKQTNKVPCKRNMRLTQAKQTGLTRVSGSV